MSASAQGTLLNARERDIVIHALRFNASRLRENFPAFLSTAVKIEALKAKLESSFATDQLFDAGERPMAISIAERRLLLECLDGLAFQNDFFMGRTSEANRIKSVAKHIGGAA